MAPNYSTRSESSDQGGSDALCTTHLQETSTLIELKGALGLPVDRPIPMNPAEVHLVDDLQDELMARQSPEGRPPRHDLRIAEWRWLALALGAVLAVFVIYAVAQSIAIGWVVVFGLLMLCMLGIGVGPVLYAGLLRGSEEKEARDTAKAVVKHDATLTR